MALKRPTMTGFKLALAVTMMVAALYYFLGDSLTLLKKFELQTLDFKFILRGPVEPPDDVVVVAIDDYSIERLGRWPWSRAYNAELVDLLAGDGAKAIGFDLIFAEPEESLELTTMRQLKQYYRALDISGSTLEGKKFGALLEEAVNASNNDRIFSDSIARNNNVIIALVFQAFGQPDAGSQEGEALADNSSFTELPTESGQADDIPPEDLFNEEPTADIPYELLEEEGNPPDTELPPEGLFGDEPFNEDMLVPLEVKDAAIRSIDISDWASVPQAQDLLLPLPEFYSTAKDLGHVNTFSDTDGNLRWASLMLRYSDRYYPALGIKMLKEYYGLDNQGIRTVPGKGIFLGERHMPVDRQGRLLINYYGPARSFKYYAYSDVIEGMLPQGTFDGKMVLVGYAATGLGDVWTTPFSRAMPGVEKHATVIGNVLEGDYLHRAGRSADVIFIMVLGLLLGYYLPKLSPLRVAAFSVITIMIVLAASFAFFYFFKIWINGVYPMLTALMVPASVITYKFFTEEKEKRLVKKAFKQYLSPALVEELVKHPENLRLGGEQKELTVLFSDIRDFTSISEKLTPEKLVSLLNVYLSAMTGIIIGNKGLVDKFIGDAIMAVYGAPIHFEEHPQMACTAAVKMISELNKQMPEWLSQGFPEFRIGVGINTGEMIAGNMGSEDRFDYTVMGDSVNLASRLEGLSKAYGASIIISESTASGIDGFALRELDMVRVKGKVEPVRIFEVLGFVDDCRELEDELALYRDALGLYRSRQWVQAMGAFESLEEKSGLKLYELYARRSRDFLNTPPPSNWDGVFTFTKK
jgi:adenylate cyclase